MSASRALRNDEDNQLVAEDVDDWLDKVCSLQSSCHLLNSFLGKLLAELSQTNDIKWLLTNRFPNLCRLLSKLCCNRTLLIDADTCSSVLKCLLAIMTPNPSSKFEKSANQWAELQIRGTMCYSCQDKPYLDGIESIGCFPSQYNDLALYNLVQSLCADLDDLSRKECQGFSHHKEDTLRKKSIHGVSSRCLPLLGSSQILPLVEALLSTHFRSARSENLSKDFLESVARTQENAYTGHCCLLLSYKSIVSLWLRYMPALKKEVINLLNALIPINTNLPKYEIHKLAESRYLVRACINHIVIHAYVTSILDRVFGETRGSPQSARIMAIFNQSFVTAHSQCTVQPIGILCNYYDKELSKLICLLQVKPSELPCSACLEQVGRIVGIIRQALGETNHLSGSKATILHLWMIILKFDWWINKSLELLLLLDADKTSQVLWLLAWFLQPMAQSHSHISVLLRKCVIKLQSQRFEVGVKLGVLLSTGHHLRTSVLEPFQKKILFVFILNSNCDSKTIKELISTLFPRNDIHDQVTFLLDGLYDFLSISDNSNISKQNISAVASVLNSLYQDMVNSSCDYITNAHQNILSDLCQKILKKLNNNNFTVQ